MAYNDPQLLHVDAMLTEISSAYRNGNFVGDELFPRVGVTKESAKYYVHERTGNTVFDDIRTPGANTNEIPPMSLSRDSYFADEHAIKDWVHIEEERNADSPLTPRQDAAERVSDTVLLNRENAIQTIARTTTNYATGHTVTLSGTTQWSDYTNSTPVTDLRVARDAINLDTGFMPTVGILGYDVATKLEDHPKFLDRIKTTLAGRPATNSLDVIGEVIGLPRLVRASATYNTAAWGLTQANARLWGKDVIIAYVPPAPGRKIPAYGYEFVLPWDGGGDIPTDTWYDNDRKSTAVRATRRYDLKLIAVDTVASGKSTGGYLIKNAVA